jgi:N utilization substance protein A
MGTSALYQSIELLSQEKGIDPGIVVGAVEEAIALATRKFYKTQENMRGELNRETGAITAYIYKTVVADEEQVEDPVNQITLEEANELAPGVEVGSEIRMYRDGLPRSWPSRSSSRRSAKRNGIRSSRSMRTARRKC